MLGNGLGALARASAISFCIMMPALFLAPKADGASSLILIISFLAGALVWMEYTNTYPSIIEFRDCRPFNRIRFLHLAILILLVSRFIQYSNAVNLPIGVWQEFYHYINQIADDKMAIQALISPLKTHFPTLTQTSLAGVSVIVVALIVLSVVPFAIWTLVTDWPMSRRDFNVWTNLPFLEPNKSPNLAVRLRTTAYVNVFVGLAFPLFFPATVGVFAPIYLKGAVFSLQETAWIFVLWGAIPVSLMMRGFAILSVSKGVSANEAINLENAT